jgi:MFS family permease
MKRRTRVLLISSFASNMAGGVFWTFIGLQLYDLQASYFQIALLDSLAAIMFILSRVWGAASDYYGLRKPFIIFGNLVSAIPIFFCGFVSSTVQLILLFMISSFFSSISFSPFLAALTAVEKKGRMVGWYSMLSTIGWAIGTFLMGFIDQLYRAFGVYLISAMLLVISALVMVLYPGELQLTRTESLRNYLKTAFSFKFKAPKEFSWLLLATFLSWLGFQWAGPLIRMRFYDVLQHSKVTLGMVWGLSAFISGAIVSPLAGKITDKIGGGKLLLTTAVMYAFYIPLFAVVNDPFLFSVLWIVPLWTFNWVALLATPAQMTKETVRGEAMGAINTALNFGVFVGVTGGLFADQFSRELGIIISPIFFAASVIALLPVIRYFKRALNTTKESVDAKA